MIEGSWLIYRLSNELKVLSWGRKKIDGHISIEKICEANYGKLKQAIDSKWILHRCEEDGCAARMVVIDGNEKLYRYICSKTIEKVKEKNGEANRVLRCVNNPRRGNQNCSGSKMCEEHSNGDSEISKERLDFRRLTREYRKTIDDIIISGEGCKIEDNVTKYKDRTAGMLYLFRSCGVRLSHCEMYTAESLSTVFSSLIDTFSCDPS